MVKMVYWLAFLARGLQAQADPNHAILHATRKTQTWLQKWYRLAAGAQVRTALKPLGTMLPWCWKGFREPLRGPTWCQETPASRIVAVIPIWHREILPPKKKMFEDNPRHPSKWRRFQGYFDKDGEPSLSQTPMCQFIKIKVTSQNGSWERFYPRVVSWVWLHFLSRWKN